MNHDRSFVPTSTVSYNQSYHMEMNFLPATSSSSLSVSVSKKLRSCGSSPSSTISCVVRQINGCGSPIEHRFDQRFWSILISFSGSNLGSAKIETWERLLNSGVRCSTAISTLGKKRLYQLEWKVG